MGVLLSRFSSARHLHLELVMPEAKQELLRALARAIAEEIKPWGTTWFSLVDCDPYRTQEIPAAELWRDTMPDLAAG